jgi:hypothetical protein
MDHVVYERGWVVEPQGGPAGAPAAGSVETLATVVPPYFNRDHLHFSSHAQTPPALSPGAPLPADCPPAAVRTASTVSFAFPLCRAYRRHGSQVYKTLVRNAVDALLPQRLVTAGLPSAGQVTVLRQPGAGDRLIVHLLYYPAERRTPELDVIEDTVPLRDVPLAVRPGFRPARVYEAPGQAPLPFDWGAGEARLVLPRLEGHAMVVFEP